MTDGAAAAYRCPGCGRAFARVWCACCLQWLREPGVTATLDVGTWIHQLPPAFLAPRPPPPDDADMHCAHCHERQSPLICGACVETLTHPYVWPLDKEGTRFARLVYVTSRLLRAELGLTERGLVALDAIPAGAALAYVGLMLTEYQIDALHAELGVQLSKLRAKGGVKQRGLTTVIFAQFAPDKPLYGAHRVNAATGSRGMQQHANCRWSTVKVTPAFVRLYPDFATSVALGEHYPALRTSRDVARGDELLVRSYSSGYWQRAAWERNHASSVYTACVLTPAMAAVIAAHAQDTLPYTRQGVKRHRRDSSDNESDV